MASPLLFGTPVFKGTGIFPVSRGRFRIANGQALGRQSLPTDPIGLFNLTLNNVVIESRIHIEDQAGTTIMYDNVASSTSVSITIQVYVTGSALNNLRIKVRKGTESTFYQPWETQTTSIIGSTSIYVSQIPDE